MNLLGVALKAYTLLQLPLLAEAQGMQQQLPHACENLICSSYGLLNQLQIIILS